MLNGLYAMDPDRFDDVYGPDERTDIERLVRVTAPPRPGTGLDPGRLAETDVLITGWGGPRIDAALLDAAPRLRLVLYGAGSVRSVVTDELWARGVRVTSAATAIAESVAEFALAQILLTLKHAWRYAIRARDTRQPTPRLPEAGTAGGLVGLVSLGATGRATARLLARHDVSVQAFDPHAGPEAAAELGVRLTGLDELFATSSVISLHTPVLPETRGMVGRGLLESMGQDATLINTARGELVDETALVAVLRERPDLFAVLDVTHPEPPPPGSPLFELPNVVVTPHLAGSLGPERRRQGRLMADELARYVAGRPLQHEITAAGLAVRA